MVLRGTAGFELPTVPAIPALGLTLQERGFPMKRALRPACLLAAAVVVSAAPALAVSAIATTAPAAVVSAATSHMSPANDIIWD